MRLYEIRLEVVNSPTILSRVIQVIARRRMSIQKFIAEVTAEDKNTGKITVQLETEEGKITNLKTQLTKLVDVIKIIY